jgi:hypothetical protein
MQYADSAVDPFSELAITPITSPHRQLRQQALPSAVLCQLGAQEQLPPAAHPLDGLLQRYRDGGPGCQPQQGRLRLSDGSSLMLFSSNGLRRTT